MTYPSFPRSAVIIFFALTLVSPIAVLAAVPLQLTIDTVLPPDPGAAGKQTLAGIDHNDNGVRDDVELFLRRHFSRDARLLRGMANVAISNQAAILATTPWESSHAHSMAIRSSECLAGLGELVPEDASKVGEVMALLVNTPQRKEAIQAHGARLANMTFVMRQEATWEPYCMERADLAGPSVPTQPRRE